MIKWLWKLTGGRPMIYKQHAFVDCVSGHDVYLWRDRRDGTLWMAEGAWSLFRVRHHFPELDNWQFE